MSEGRWVIAYIGLGSNLQQPAEQVRQALRELASLPQTRCVNHSSLFRSDPVGPQDQPDYVNAVAQLQTGLTPALLLDQLQALEQRHRRVRTGQRWGPRTLDLDLLLYGQQRIDSPRLTVPHPRLSERAFVLYPLAQLAPPDLQIPGVGTLGEQLQKVSDAGIRRLS